MTLLERTHPSLCIPVAVVEKLQVRIAGRLQDLSLPEPSLVEECSAREVVVEKGQEVEEVICLSSLRRDGRRRHEINNEVKRADAKRGAVNP